MKAKTENRLEQLKEHVDTLSRLELREQQVDIFEHLNKMVAMHESNQAMFSRQMETNASFARVISSLQKQMLDMTCEVRSLTELMGEVLDERNDKLRGSAKVPQTG
jgi:hypothetical protein